jgi:hypothetical protein
MFYQATQNRLLVVGTAVALFSLVPAPASLLAQERPENAPVTTTFEYSVKFVCGIPGMEAQREAVKPGNYATAVNIHNPNQLPNTPPIQFTKHAVQALPEDFSPKPPGGPVSEKLVSDFAMEVDCQNIRDLLHLPHDTTFIKGFLVILEPSTFTPLDVIGVYSSEPPPGQTGIGGMGLEILPVTPRTVSK